MKGFGYALMGEETRELIAMEGKKGVDWGGPFERVQRILGIKGKMSAPLAASSHGRRNSL